MMNKDLDKSKKKKIGIVTFHSSSNYGAHLQCYALQTVLQNLGYDVIIINREWGEYPLIKQSFSLRKMIYYIRRNKFKDFRNQYFNLSFLIKSDLDLNLVSKGLDAIIVGSDQIWNSDCISTMGLYYYLDWVPDKIQKFSYAVSFGKDTFNATSEQIEKIANLLSTYRFLSVRESSGVEICKNVFHVTAQCHVDPTLLLSCLDYAKLIPFKKARKCSYLCQFFLDVNQDKVMLANRLRNILDLNLVDNNPRIYRFRKWINPLKYDLPSIPRWLNNIRNSSFVITDSYHGVIFSILFNREFICVNNIKRGSARFVSLLSLLGLEDRLVNCDEIDRFNIESLKSIDYERVNNIIKKEQEKSFLYLKSIGNYDSFIGSH